MVAEASKCAASRVMSVRGQKLITCRLPKVRGPSSRPPKSYCSCRIEMSGRRPGSMPHIVLRLGVRPHFPLPPVFKCMSNENLKWHTRRSHKCPAEGTAILKQAALTECCLCRPGGIVRCYVQLFYFMKFESLFVRFSSIEIS